MFLIHNDPRDAPLLAGALVAACRLSTGWSSPLQVQWLDVLFRRLLDFECDFYIFDPALPIEVRHRLSSPLQRLELLELMVSLEMLCSPIPDALRCSVENWADILELESDALTVVRELARDGYSQATRHWYQYSWFGQDIQQQRQLIQQLQNHGTMAFMLTFESNPQEAERWHQLKLCPEFSLGRCMHDFLLSISPLVPGDIGGASPIVASHDWIHVITGYGIDPLGEIATAAYTASSARTSKAMLAFLGTISIFETSLLRYHTAQLDPTTSSQYPLYQGALSRPGALELVVSAIQAGDRCPIIPLKDINYFAVANEPLAEIRKQWKIPVDGLMSQCSE
jgi:hypothetical protein